MSDHERCQATKDDGTRCKVTFGLSDDGLCWHHNPKLADERRRAMKNGGHATAAQRRKVPRRVAVPADLPTENPPETPAEAKLWSAWAVWANVLGIIDDRTAREIEYGVRTFLTAHEKAETEEEVAELKRQVAKLKGGADLKAVP